MAKYFRLRTAVTAAGRNDTDKSSRHRYGSRNFHAGTLGQMEKDCRTCNHTFCHIRSFLFSDLEQIHPSLQTQ